MTLWEIDVYPATAWPDFTGQRLAADAADLGLARHLQVLSGHGFLLQAEFPEAEVQRLARELFSDPVGEQTRVGRVGDARFNEPYRPLPAAGRVQILHVLPKPGVMDPVAQSALGAIRDFGLQADAVRTFRKFWVGDLAADQLQALGSKLLANDSIEQLVVGPLQVEQLQVGSRYAFQRVEVPLREADDEALARLSRDGQLYLTLVEMQTIRDYYRRLGREPSDIELETIAQTWSEHCSHKTLRGHMSYRDERGSRQFQNMLKETIFAATTRIRETLGADDWCVSVFEDNAGVVRFDEQFNVVFKVETHNHPSAIEPYGGANTGIGGVIRDPLGTGLGAKPICNTDVFCFAPPDTPADALPPGVLHPRRVMKGVVAGVRDYGNRMGIPTVNGAIYFDSRYLGNPLVYCGNAGLLPRDKSRKRVEAGDWIVALGGRTGRDGIHGATFSSAELTSESESVSGGAVQIGNAITEKMVLDVLLAARDQGLFHAVTDCGAGGFSSAVGEMAEHLGADVWLEKAPLKYEGLSYAEVWISEAQERMVLAIAPEAWEAFDALCRSEGVEATRIGRFTTSGRLLLKYQEQLVGDLDLQFLHEGRPPIVREATYQPPPEETWQGPTGGVASWNELLRKILGSWNVASKEWVIRQYDHEVQGGSVIKPLVGVQQDGPADAAVLRPILSSRRGLVIACGMNPRYGDFDPYHMAASAIDEAVRNCVAVGADPARIAILDNFCWGYTDRPETLGSLVRAALACHDVAVSLGTPFISGKDSLNNEFSYADADGNKRTISIPPSLLISALGQVDDVSRCVTMDLKQPGNRLYLVGNTYDELGGSHLSLVTGARGGRVPRVDAAQARRIFAAVHEAIDAGTVRACHDLSEGGLAVAAAEMAFAGGFGAQLDLAQIPWGAPVEPSHQHRLGLFSESNSRFLCEVPSDRQAEFEQHLRDIPFGLLGEVIPATRLQICDSGSGDDAWLVDCSLEELKQAWQAPLRW